MVRPEQKESRINWMVQKNIQQIVHHLLGIKIKINLTTHLRTLIILKTTSKVERLVWERNLKTVLNYRLTGQVNCKAYLDTLRYEKC